MYFKVLITILLSLNLYANTLAVIVSQKSNINTISEKELSRIFLSKTKNFSNGEKSLTIELDNEKYQSIFYRKISNKNLKQLKKYWLKMIFTGLAMPPKKVDTINELLNFIQTNPNAISYMPIEYTNETTKIIMEIK